MPLSPTEAYKRSCLVQPVKLPTGVLSCRQLVASSLVCLPAVDAGGAGPKAESWAFGTDAEGLRILEGAGVFGVRACKLCNDGIVVQVRAGATEVWSVQEEHCCCGASCGVRALWRMW